MRKKRIGALALASLAALPTLVFRAGCRGLAEIVLRVFKWVEYIDLGGEGSY